MKATKKRTKLKDDAIVTLFYELDVDLIKRIEENILKLKDMYGLHLSRIRENECGFMLLRY